jgi:hypothetical protein
MFRTLLNHYGENLQLSRDLVENINLSGGSFLGVSRGGAKTSEIVDSIQVTNLKWKTLYSVLQLQCCFCDHLMFVGQKN